MKTILIVVFLVAYYLLYFHIFKKKKNQKIQEIKPKGIINTVTINSADYFLPEFAQASDLSEILKKNIEIVDEGGIEVLTSEKISINDVNIEFDLEIITEDDENNIYQEDDIAVLKEKPASSDAKKVLDLFNKVKQEGPPKYDKTRLIEVPVDVEKDKIKTNKTDAFQLE